MQLCYEAYTPERAWSSCYGILRPCARYIGILGVRKWIRQRRNERRLRWARKTAGSGMGCASTYYGGDEFQGRSGVGDR